MEVIGIDPGLNGGLALVEYLDGKGTCRGLMPMPILGGEIDVPYLSTFVSGTTVAFVERQQTMPKQGIASSGKTMYGFGLIVGAVKALKIPLEIVHPKTWQKEFGISSKAGDTKELGAKMACSLYPGIDFRKSERCKNLHDGMTDAILIATYGLRKYMGVL